MSCALTATSDDARLGVDGKPVEGRAGSGSDHNQRTAVGGFKSRGEGVRAFDDHQRGVRFKRSFDAGGVGANPAEGDGQILEPGGVRMGQHGSLFLQLVQRLAGTVEIKRISQHEKGFLFSHDDIPYSTGSNPLLFFPPSRAAGTPCQPRKMGYNIPFPRPAGTSAARPPHQSKRLGDEGWGGGGPGEGRRRPFPKGPFSPGFFIYSAYFTILGSSMIW